MNRLKGFSRFFSVAAMVAFLLTMDTAKDLFQRPDDDLNAGFSPGSGPAVYESAADGRAVADNVVVIEAAAAVQKFILDDEPGMTEPAPDDALPFILSPYMSQRSDALISPTSASVNTSSRNGFFLWDLLDGIAGIGRSIVNTVGRFFTSLFQVIGNVVNAILDGLKWLFIPSRQSFTSFRDDILQSFDKKFGSVFSALNYLNTRFSDLRSKNMRNEFIAEFPQESFLYGMKIDVLAGGMGLLGWARFVITGVICLVTFLTCLHKVTSMVEK